MNTKTFNVKEQSTDILRIMADALKTNLTVQESRDLYVAVLKELSERGSNA